MSSSVSISRIDSPAEASRRQLGSIRPESITKIVFIVRNESTVTTLTDSDEIAKFHLNNATLEVEHREDYDCLAMTAESGASKGFTSVMVYTDGEPDGYTLVVDLEAEDAKGLPFNARFVAGPFKDEQAAELFAVDLLISQGSVTQDGDGNFALKDDPSEVFNSRADLLEAYQDCLGMFEWFHIFPALRVPTAAARPPKPAN